VTFVPNLETFLQGGPERWKDEQPENTMPMASAIHGEGEQQQRRRRPATNHTPLFGILFEQAGQQGLGFGRQVLGEADLLHENKFKETLVVLVVEGQPTAHHLVHDHAQPPPVHRSAVVVVF